MNDGIDWTEAPDGRGGMLFIGPHANQIQKIILGRQEPGALPNGARIRKIKSEKSDRTPDGTLGTVLGSIGGETIRVMGFSVTHGYLVEWDNCKDQAVFTVDFKIAEVS